MSEAENKQVVQAILESFGRGDMAGLLANVAENVDERARRGVRMRGRALWTC
ncbi:MAG: hypothetical protein H7Z38_03720 [Rubrivivax sp.]|nr:hypothetical protein [Pyrinomonadaceae bacterium]